MNQECVCCNGAGEVDEVVGTFDMVTGQVSHEETGKKKPCPVCQVEYYESLNDKIYESIVDLIPNNERSYK